MTTRPAFRRAVQEDVCPLRILPGMAEDIVGFAEARNLPLVDFEALITATALEETGLPVAGREYFLDHVHPTIRANGLLAAKATPVILAAAGRPPAGPTADQFDHAESRITARLDPAKRARSLANLAAVLAWAGKIEDAVDPALRALEFPRDDPLTVLTAAGILATWYATSGDGDLERSYYRMALNANPLNHDTHWRIGLRALDRQPPEVELACAHILHAAVFWQGAQRDAPHRLLGEILASRGRLQAGFSHLLEADKIDPGNPETGELIQRTAGRLGAVASTIDTPKFTVEKYPSGNIRNIVQVRLDPTGRPQAHGVWTEWHEGGEPALYREMAAGNLLGAEVAWDAEGREIRRAGPGER